MCHNRSWDLLFLENAVAGWRNSAYQAYARFEIDHVFDRVLSLFAQSSRIAECELNHFKDPTTVSMMTEPQTLVLYDEGFLLETGPWKNME